MLNDETKNKKQKQWKKDMGQPANLATMKTRLG
jgi:hypothetical protein